MFRTLLAITLLAPCPTCWMQQVVSLCSSSAEEVASTCDCPDHAPATPTDHQGDEEKAPTPVKPSTCSCKFAIKSVPPTDSRHELTFLQAFIAEIPVTDDPTPFAGHIDRQSRLGDSTHAARTAPLRQ